MRGVKDKIEPGSRSQMLTVIREIDGLPKGSLRQVEIQCDCGRRKVMAWRDAKYGRIQSCGCITIGERGTVDPAAVAGARWIPTTKGKWTLVDEDVYPSVLHLRWSLSGGERAYACSRIGKRFVRLHHLVIGEPPTGMQVDHINGNKLDNRRCNLRFATNSQNCQNKPPGMGRQWKGLQKYKCGWMARIRTPAGRICLGTFKTEIDAARAYNEAAKRLHGEFAWLNPIPDEVD